MQTVKIKTNAIERDKKEIINISFHSSIIGVAALVGIFEYDVYVLSTRIQKNFYVCLLDTSVNFNYICIVFHVSCWICENENSF